MARSFPVRSLVAGLAALALPALAQAAPAVVGDAAKGEALFKQRCAICHYVVEDNKTHPAPLLKGVVGRKAASTSFKGYSPALKASGKTWTTATLDTFLTDPGKLVPGTFMVVSLPKDDERHDVIAYLASLK
jgi:cytochrome c